MTDALDELARFGETHMDELEGARLFEMPTAPPVVTVTPHHYVVRCGAEHLGVVEVGPSERNYHATYRGLSLGFHDLLADAAQAIVAEWRRRERR